MSTKSPSRATRVHAEAVDLLARGRTDRAAAKFTEAIALDERLADAHIGRYACGHVDSLAAAADHSPRIGETGPRVPIHVTLDEHLNVPADATGVWLGVAARHLAVGSTDRATTILAGLAGHPAADYLAARHATEPSHRLERLETLAANPSTSPRVACAALTAAADLLIADGRDVPAVACLKRAATLGSHAAAERLSVLGIKPETFSATPPPTARSKAPLISTTDGYSGEVAAILAGLDSLVGQPEIKEQVRSLLAQVQVAKAREVTGLKVGQIGGHMVFAGHPGTGKTTIAQVVADLYHALGILPTAKKVEVSRTDLVGQHIGETEKKTSEILDEAMGGVLFIDEAYSLVGTGNDFGKQAIDTLLKALEDHRGEFICIVAGYPDEMETFLDSNPGMRSRFPTTITFESYTPADLVEITERMAEAGDNILHDDARQVLLTRLTTAQEAGDFDAKTWGNARTVRNVLDEACARRDSRIRRIPARIDVLKTLTAIDVAGACDKLKIGLAETREETVEQVLAEVDAMVGQPQVKTEIRSLVSQVRTAQARERLGLAADFTIGHLVLLGPPGTGKTQTARLLARLYRALDLLPSSGIVETDRSGLVDAVVGGSEQKTTAVIDSAIGKTLFIDEAYSLVGTGNDFGPRAIEVLLKRMEDQRGQFSVIAAGYEGEMCAFLDSNPGLRSRFTTTIHLTPYAPDELVEIAISMARANENTLDARAIQAMRARLEAHQARGGFDETAWANARSVRTAIDKAAQTRNTRLFTDGRPADSVTRDDLTTITAADIDATLDSLGIAAATLKD